VTADTPAITQDEADALLMNELGPTCDEVDSSVTASATDGQLAALYSFTYNEGTHALATSTLLRLLNNGDVEGAAAQFARWNLVKGVVSRGLIRRRALEKSVFQGLTIP
jgi:lysozyme